MTRPNCIERAHVVALTKDWLGTPYVHQASAKGTGTDCLGLIRGIWRELYGREPETPPPYTPDWAERTGTELLLQAAGRWLEAAPGNEILPGGILLFRIVADGPAKHLGIVSGEGRFIHAYAGRAVSESWLSRWWLGRLAGLYDFPGVV